MHAEATHAENRGNGVTSQLLSINALINIIQNTARGPWKRQQRHRFASFYFSLLIFSFFLHSLHF